MSAALVRAALIGAFVLVTGAALLVVRGHERTLAIGQVVLIELAPVDPRSLMQGDYMALRFAIDDELRQHAARDEPATDRESDTFTESATDPENAADRDHAAGPDFAATPERAPAAMPRYAHLALDDARRATLAAVGDQLPPPESGHIAIRIRSRDGRWSIGPNAFFFEEGSAQRFETAQWGEFRVDGDGKALLTHLRDGGLERLGEIVR